MVNAKDRLSINVGGIHHETYVGTLMRLPKSRLADLARAQEKDPSYNVETREYYFDRNPLAFQSLLHYYRTGELHVEQNICGRILEEEMSFWCIPRTDIEPCCWTAISKSTTNDGTLRKLDETFYAYEDDFPQWCQDKSSLQITFRKIWRFLNDPATSVAAKIYSLISFAMVLISVASFVISTYPDARIPMSSDSPYYVNMTECVLNTSYNECIQRYIHNYNNTEHHQVFDYVDWVTTVFFTVEFVSRTIFSPDKCQYFRSFMNILDFFILVPFYTALALKYTVAKNKLSKSIARIFKILFALRILRLFRIFKLGKTYAGFKVLLHTIKVSFKELLVMIVFLITGVIIFASAVHFSEPIVFDSIPIGIWYALQTMTVVGFGDIVPVETYSYPIASVCVISGVLVIAFSVPIVVNNFKQYYSHAMSRIKLPPRKRQTVMKKVQMHEHQPEVDKRLYDLEKRRKSSVMNIQQGKLESPPRSTQTPVKKFDDSINRGKRGNSNFNEMEEKHVINDENLLEEGKSIRTTYRRETVEEYYTETIAFFNNGQRQKAPPPPPSVLDGRSSALDPGFINEDSLNPKPPKTAVSVTNVSVREQRHQEASPVVSNYNTDNAMVILEMLRAKQEGLEEKRKKILNEQRERQNKWKESADINEILGIEEDERTKRKKKNSVGDSDDEG